MALISRATVISALFVLTTASAQAAVTPAEMHVPKTLRKQLKSFEPSAALYLPESDSYLIASDDTDEKDSAMLFLMSPEGEVKKEPVYFDGLSTLTDIESISAEDGFVYTLSSMSRNKNGKNLKARNLLTRSRLHGTELRDTDSLNLRPLLLKALLKSRDPVLKSMRDDYDDLLEAESHFVREGKLFVGLKDPQPRPGVGVVLDLGDVDKIFRDQSVDDVQLAYQIDFGGKNKMSDMVIDDGRLLFSSSREGDGGSVWSFDEDSEKLKRLRNYHEQVPEGLAPARHRGDVMIVFDQNLDPALFAPENL